MSSNFDLNDLDLGPIKGTEWKWGLSRESQFEIWEVGGPGDGFPSHHDQLDQAWGRRHDVFNGDIVGNAIVDEHTVTITAYFAPTVPAAAIAWAQTTFPGYTLTLRPAGQA